MNQELKKDDGQVRNDRSEVEEDASTVRVSSLLSGNDEDAFDDSNNDNSSSTNNMPNLNQPIYISSGEESWELTWPIFHMLPRSERKAIALRQGFEHIGDFEESMILNRALALNNSNHTSDMVNEGEISSMNKHPNGSIDDTQLRSERGHSPTEEQRVHFKTKPSAVMIHDEENSYIDDDNDQSIGSSSTVGAVKDMVDEDVSCNQEGEEDISNGGHMIQLPDDLIINHIFSYIGVEHFYYCALVSVTWKHFTRTEQVYREICKRCYLKQSKRKTLNVSRFGSFRAMLEKRPRVRTGRGIYVLKYSKIRKVQRDMWTEVPVGAILETIYYRYLSFQENDGVVFYALTAKPPYEMIPNFLTVQKRSSKDGYSHEDRNSSLMKNGIVQGTYEVSGKTVKVNVSHPWHDVQMEMNLIENCEGVQGKFSVLQLAKHFSSESGNFDEYWSPDLVEYKVPIEHFYFLRDARL